MADAGVQVPAGLRSSAEIMEAEDRFGARNYSPLPVVVSHAEGAWVTDVEGRRYLDMLSAYSALNFGHRNQRLLDVVRSQLDHVTLTSRAFHNDQLGPFSEELAQLCRLDRVLPMNTGAEAVETAIKLSRAWGYRVKGVPRDQAVIVTCEGNFHGRTTTIVSFSTDPVAHDDFGPYTPGFVTVPFGDVEALRAALADDNVVAFLVEPVQGEAGVIVPPAGYLRAARELCTERGVLLVADEVQSGLGRTGRTFTCEHEDVLPDMYVLGKALGGGVLPVSAVVGRDEVVGVLRPGEHGSTFGGNPLAAAVGREVVAMLATGEYQRRSAELGEHLLGRLRAEAPPTVREVRGLGLWAGVELVPEAGPARDRCYRLIGDGVLVKDTHETTIRLAPPLSIEASDLDWALDRILKVLH
ncbi:MAG: ornithine--oxo-acid transaminase [Actinomycetia bacterium]|nr:ornithine--oxo-acid transaminase [Actinomycetes bacterium]